MLKQEAIKLKTNRRGTFIKYFTTYSGQTSEDGSYSYLITDLANTPVKIVDSYFDTQVYRNADNNFLPLSGINIYTGTTIKQTSEFLNPSQKSDITNGYIQRIQNQHLADSINYSGTSPYSYVNFEDAELDDMFINISIQRTVDTLDTLNVYNVPINNTPTFESKTGVLFGKLEAIQNISDENGDKIRIPLKNTPIAIFNPSDEFPNIGVNNAEDNRITLNLKENINIGTYFNIQSEKTDLKYLTDTSEFETIPEKYKYSAVTNEKGEFVLYDVPIGEQTFLYEVNLLKHGLTADEVALNFFPYPTEDVPNVDKVPHYFFRQVPVNIVPSWGDAQSGYTQLNISVTLDLRKWCTYYVSPIAYKNKTLEEMFADGTTTRLTCGIRDMTKKIEESRTDVEIVEVADIYSRNFNQVTEWAGEFKQKKNKAEFFTTNFNVFKLPANLYDPNGINSKGETGVWLNAYQIKMFYADEENIYRATGFEREWLARGPVGRTHYDLNKNAVFGVYTSKPQGKLGVFPYEKPWTINYPEPYKIPKKPQQANPNKIYDQYGNSNNPTEPPFLDGDKAGFDVNTWCPVSGYGFQDIGGNFNGNMFSRQVTKFNVFKYEQSVHWDEQYSNGYQPTFPNTFSPFGTVSTVLNGEKWQRLEAGYAYWLKPEGWPRIDNHNWGDTLVNSDFNEITQYGPFPPYLFSPDSYNNSIYKARENILLRMDNGIQYKTGAIDIYKVDNPDLVLPQLPPAVQNFVKINFQDLLMSGSLGRQKLRYGNGEGEFNDVHNGELKIRNKGTTKVTISVGGTTLELEPNTEGSFDKEVNSGMSIILPANNNFDSNTNSYLSAKYELILWSVFNNTDFGGPHDANAGNVCYGGELKTFNQVSPFGNFDNNGLPAGPEENIPNYYLTQVIPTIVKVPTTVGNFFWNIASTTYLPLKLAINGFIYHAYTGDGFIYATNNWVTVYYPGYPSSTRNPITYFTTTPLSTITAYTGPIVNGRVKPIPFVTIN